ncbi:MAG: thioredoxin-disulfide reductase [Anaerofustis stercorihominis]|nr:thioredoxin-disulfide reductase [Anaerofustis stercorihominis]
MSNKYDICIIGAGPGGLSAALYAARSELKVLVIEKQTVGGLITTTTEVENYPGSERDATGTSITQRMYEQAEEAGSEFVYDYVSKIEKDGENFKIICDLDEYTAKAVIISTGSEPNMAGVPGETEFRGRGVSYCATCDAGFFKGKKIAVLGGGDTAVKEAHYLSKFASELYIIHRRDTLRAGVYNIRKIEADENVKVLYSTVPVEIKGDMKVNALAVKDLKEDRIYDLEVDGVFVFVGFKPNTEFLEGMLELDEGGYIITDDKMHTSAEGIFAVGDVRNTPLRQVITAAADGAVAAVYAQEYIDGK